MVSLLSPGVNVLGVNASYLPDSAELDRAQLRAVYAAHDLPPLIASPSPIHGTREVARGLVGDFEPLPLEVSAAVVVEQVSRLQLALWADVLAQAYGTPAWAGAIARHLAHALERENGYVLLLAYTSDEPVAALLWRGGQAHLWGALNAGAAQAVLHAAYELSGNLRYSAMADTVPHPAHADEVIYSLLEG